MKDYFNNCEIQVLIPIDGYKKLFENLLSNKKIKIILNTDYLKIKENKFKPKYYTIYSGPNYR